MATRKPRATTKAKGKEPPKPAKPAFRLDPDRIEEIVAILVIILAVLTALGALNLSGGFLLSAWTQLLQALLGWGVYFAPFVLLGLGIWLVLDALDKTWTLGWERPIAILLLYAILLGVLHAIAQFDHLLQPPRAFQGGGYVGFFIASLVINAFGEVGAFLALLALTGIALILLLNLSLPELGRRLIYLARIILHLPQELERFRQRRAPLKLPPTPVIHTPRSGVPPAAPKQPSLEKPTLPASPPRPRLIEEAPAPAFPPLPQGPVSARIIGGASTPAATPVIQREWRLPDWQTMLEESVESEINQKEIRERVHKIEETLAHFGVPAKVLEVNQGPTITQFGVEPGFVEQKGPDGRVHRVKVKVSRISALQHDLELALAAAPIRIEAPIPGKSMVGIEVPNSQIAVVSLRSVMESEAFIKLKAKSTLAIALGQDVAGQPIVDDLARMPHLLIAGATGSGKSVSVNAMIACLLCTTTPSQVQFVMIDPKRVELVNLNGIPHLRQPVVVEMDQAVAALHQVVNEMDRRFKVLAQHGARNIEIYNQMIEGKADAERLPFLIVIVDELADLMMIAPDDVEKAITRLAQMARATGIHLILATQRPSVDVVTGLIKANFPSRISFAVTSQVDSRVVLDTPGAEKLLGRGDMLYMANDSSKLVRLQGCFVSDKELERLVAYWKEAAPPPVPTTASSEPASKSTFVQTTFLENDEKAALEDDLLPDAIEIVQQSKRASVSLLQRKLKVGYSRAARLIELLEEKGYVGPDEGPTKGRAVLIKPDSKPAPQRHEFEEDEFADWSEKDWEDLDKE